MPASPRLEPIRRLLVSESATPRALAHAAEQLCEKTTDAAVKLRLGAMNRLSEALRIDNHPLLRKGSTTMRLKDIPARSHLSSLQRITKLVLTDTRNLRSKIDNQQRIIKSLQKELNEYIESLTEDRSQSFWSSDASQSTATSQFIAQVSAIARNKWPKRFELESALKLLNRLNRQLDETEISSSDPKVTPENLCKKRLRKIARVLDAAKSARQARIDQRKTDRRHRAQATAVSARNAARKLNADKRRKERVDRLQADLDRENFIIQATAQRFVNGENLVDVIEHLRQQGVAEHLRIAYQAGIHARNVLL